MNEVLKEWNSHKIMDLSWDVHEVTINFKDIIFPWLLWINPDDPGKLVDELIDYRKIH